MGVRPENKESIDRIDNSKGYYPENCRWADRKQQNRNKRSNHFVEYRGEVRCIGEWAEILGVPSRRIAKRLSKGVSADRAFKNINLASGRPLKAEVLS